MYVHVVHTPSISYNVCGLALNNISEHTSQTQQPSYLAVDLGKDGFGDPRHYSLRVLKCTIAYPTFLKHLMRAEGICSNKWKPMQDRNSKAPKLRTTGSHNEWFIIYIFVFSLCSMTKSATINQLCQANGSGKVRGGHHMLS